MISNPFNNSGNPPQAKPFQSVSLNKEESWCIYGANNSGIAQFVKLIENDSLTTPVLPAGANTAVVSFAKQHEIFEEEMRNDQTDFLDKIDPGTPASAFIQNLEQHSRFIAAFNLGECMSKGYRQLSSGESRKLMLLSCVSKNPDVLLIENPYDGVDADGCLELDNLLHYLHRQGLLIIITVNNQNDIPHWCTHLGFIHKGGIALHGKKGEVLEKLKTLDKDTSAIQLSVTEDAAPQQGTMLPGKLIELQDGFASYGETSIFSNLQLLVRRGQHTLITGPNGSGKSTLLHIITGDNQNCYTNNLRIFGIQRGSGESIWELKQHMGIVTPELHRNYHIPGSTLQVVLSGFFDSIGVYKNFSNAQKNEAIQWLKMTGLKEKVKTPFRQLSYAEQRLCLIARALIKLPPLLILDEPTQGLDQHNRNSLLDFLEIIADRKLSTILYASHRRDEFRDFFKQHLDLSEY